MRFDFRSGDEDNRLLRSLKIGSVAWVFSLVCMVGLKYSASGAAAKRTGFTGTEYMGGITDTRKWITDGSKIYIANLTKSSIESASDPSQSSWRNSQKANKYVAHH